MAERIDQVNADSQMSPEPNRRHKHPRRQVLLGLVGLAAAGGGLAWWLSFHSSPTQSPPPPQPTRLYMFKRHTSPVRAIVWSPDGTRLASGGDDGTVQVWESDNGQQVFTYTGHTHNVTGGDTHTVYAVAWSPDGKHLASGGDDGTVQVWESDNGRQLLVHREEYGGVYLAIAWSPDGKRLSAANDNNVRVFDATNWRQISVYPSFDQQPANVLAWSPDGTRLASGGDDGMVQVTDVSNSNRGRLISTYIAEHKEVNSVVWSPDGTRLASANTYGAPVQISVSDATNGHLISTYTGYPENSFEEVVNIAWSPDGKYLAASVSVEDGPPDYNKTYMVQVWDAGNNHHVCSINMEPDGASTLTWSPDSKRLAIGESSGAVSMWHLPL